MSAGSSAKRRVRVWCNAKAAVVFEFDILDIFSWLGTPQGIASNYCTKDAPSAEITDVF